MSRMNNDLISRTAVLQILYDVKDDDDTPKNYGTLLDIIRQIRELPVAFDKEQVIEKLKHLENDTFNYYNRYDDEVAFGESSAFRSAIKIIEKGGVE